VGFAHTSSGRSPDDGRFATTSWLRHDYRKQICEFLGQSEFSSHDSLCEACLKINDKDRSKNHNSQYIYSNINTLDILNDILGIIITFTNIIGKHVLRFVNKYFHNIVHSVVVSNLLLPKEFDEFSYDFIAAELGNIILFDWVMGILNKSECFLTYGLNIAARNGNLNLMKHMKNHYNCKWSEMTCLEAAKGGHLEVLKWLFEDGCPLEKGTYRMAAIGNHF
jgi:hypothetical protein